MIIELFGLPGASKTMLAKEFEQNSDFKIIKVSNKRELLFFNLIYLLKHPLKFFITLGYVIKNSPNWKLFYYKFMNFFLDTNAKYQKSFKYKNAILDQGYFQNVLSIFEKPIDGDMLRKYLNFLLWPDKLIVLDSPFSKLEIRNKSRGYFPRQKMGEDYLNQWKVVLQKNYETFKKILTTILLDYLIVDADQDIKEIYKDAHDFINK